MSERRCANCMRRLDADGGACPRCGFDSARYKPPDGALSPGSVIGAKYEIGRVLGRGGFGITYVAFDRNLELRVAVKECLPAYAARRDPSGVTVQWGASREEQSRAMENFVREARKMAKMDEIPGIVRARDCFYDNNTAYIVMDYVEGETLLQRLQRAGPLNAQECFRVLAPAMDSLAQAHASGLVHRDITPGNIMIQRVKDGEKTWVLDLGAAKDLGTRLSAPNVSAFTQMVGTPGFAPLEQYAPDGKIGPWTDVYSLSAVFVYAVTGNNLPMATNRVYQDSAPDLLRPLPGKLGEVLLKGLAPNFEERYQSMTELRDALKKALKDIAEAERKTEVLPPPPQPKPTPPPPTPPPKNKLLIPLIALAVLALISAGILFARSKPKPALDDNKPSAEIIASGECGENASWTLDANGLLTISGTGDMTDYHYVGEKMASNAPWSDNGDAVFNLLIQNGIASIGWYAFCDCSSLRSVTISDSVTEIGESAFLNCNSLTSVTIPDSIIKIDDWAFQNCSSLASVTIPNSVTYIGQYAFSRCSDLTSVKISDSVTNISEHTFWECSSLTSVTIPDSVTTIGESAFSACIGLTSVTIPDSVTKIKWRAFWGCSSLASVSVPAGAEIEGDAFGATTTVIRR